MNAAIITNAYDDEPSYVVGVMLAGKDEGYKEFQKRVETKVEKMRKETYPPRKGVFDAKTGEEIPLDKQKPRFVYGYLEYSITRIIDECE